MYRPTASIRTEARAPKSMPWPGTTCILAIRSARLLFPGAAKARNRLLRRSPGRQPLPDDTGEDDVRREPDDLRSDDQESDAGHAQPDDRNDFQALRAQALDQPPHGGAEGHGLLGGHAASTPRPSTERPARRRARRRAHRRATVRRGSLAHAAGSAAWLDTISTYVGQLSSSSRWVPRPTMAPSSRTTI